MEPVVPANLIPKAPVLSAKDSLNTFQIAHGFSVTPFATEPMVEKPVALDYDPAGRLWVCEMRGYMPNIDGKGEEQPIGRIVILEDSNQDGIADKSTIFLDKILLPRAIAVYPDGILYGDEKNLSFIKRDGLKPSGKSEIAIPKFMDGGNVEHKPNGLVRGLDNWLYIAKSDKRIRRAPDGSWISENTTFRGQWGVAFDNYGRIFYNTNSQFLMGDFVAPNLLDGNPSVKTKTNTTSSIGSNKPFPIRVTPGVNRAYMQKSNGYGADTLDPKTFKLTSCTAAAGFAIYRGTNFPKDWQNTALITESSINLIKAIKVSEAGNKFTGSHTFPDKEWIASTDERFRPVNIYNAPDGSVHLLDMYHGIIQHKTFLTTYLRNYYLQLGLDAPGTGHGRIYRISHKDGKSETVPNMDSLSAAELVKLLAHPNGWHRDMAQRVLVDRKDTSAASLLEQTITASTNPLAQMHALWTLEGLGKLSAAHVTMALNSQDPKVRVSALWAASKLPPNEIAAAGPAIIAFEATTPEQTIYLTRALGPIGTPAAFEKLNEIASKSKDNLVKAAAFSGLHHREADFQKALAANLTDPSLKSWITQALQKKGPSKKTPLKGEALASFNRGKSLYHGEATCFACHAPDGAGMPNLGPPLDESDWVTDNPEILAKVMLHGITGPITVNGTKYETPAEMPALAGNPAFTDEKIADIMTYIRNEWANNAPPVTKESITKIRRDTQSQLGRPYTAKDLGK
jgi:mono/diheme cytochrome c family protein/glucose/arabinose dehydrogenase